MKQKKKKKKKKNKKLESKHKCAVKMGNFIDMTNCEYWRKMVYLCEIGKQSHCEWRMDCGKIYD